MPAHLKIKTISGLHTGVKPGVLLKILVISGLLGLACTTRVSEWVLINTLPVNYSLKYVHEAIVPENVKKQKELLKSGFSTANIRFSDVEKEGTGQPYFALYYKNRLFAKYNSIEEMNSLTTSPLRRKIAGELMDGKLCVMLFLKTDNSAKDDMQLQVLRKAVDSSPFRDIVSIYELGRDSRDEAHFVSLLLNVEDDLSSINEPMLFGIFGRFKALEPLVGKGITGENIGLMIDYLTAECSCLIKDDLPGTDILFAGNWENPKPARLNKILDDNPLLSK